MADDTCKKCNNFKKGKVKDNDKLSGVNPRNVDVDRCKKTHTKITKNTFCILPGGFRKKK